MRADISLDSLARLRPVHAAPDPDSTGTAGNASGQDDGVAIAVVTTPDRARALGLRPTARLASWAVTVVDPRVMGLGPIGATAKALGRLGLSLDDMGRLVQVEVEQLGPLTGGIDGIGTSIHRNLQEHA